MSGADEFDLSGPVEDVGRGTSLAFDPSECHLCVGPNCSAEVRDFGDGIEVFSKPTPQQQGRNFEPWYGEVARFGEDSLGGDPRPGG